MQQKSKKQEKYWQAYSIRYGPIFNGNHQCYGFPLTVDDYQPVTHILNAFVIIPFFCKNIGFVFFKYEYSDQRGFK